MKAIAVALALTVVSSVFASELQYPLAQSSPAQSSGSNGNSQAALMGLGVGLAITGLLVTLHVHKIHKARAERFNIYLAEIK